MQKWYNKSMNFAEKIETLLIHDKRPTRELIDYLVDKRVEVMVDEYLSGESDEGNSNLLEVKEKTILTDNELSIPIYNKDWPWLLEEVRNSLLRYGGYLIFTPDWNIEMEIEEIEERGRKSQAIEVGFCLTLSISKTQKLAVIEKRKLQAALPVKSRATSQNKVNKANKI